MTENVGGWDLVLEHYPDAARPDVTLVRHVSLDERGAVIVDCLSEQGFPGGTAGPLGTYQIQDIPLEQDEAFMIATYVCDMKYPLDPKYEQPLTDSQLIALYAYLRDSLAPCLIALGFDIPPRPSEQTFVDTYRETGGWPIYEGVASAVSDEAEWNAVNQQCPQVPPDLYG
ncbi:MAG: hypothetical protein ABJB03_01750 [Rhodoglobus sp.]